MQTQKRTQKVNRTRVITFENLERDIRQALNTGLLDPLKIQLRAEHPANIAAVIDRLEPGRRKEVFDLLFD